MKISETSGGKFAIVEGVECRLTTRNVKKNMDLLDGVVYEISNRIYYNTDCICGGEVCYMMKPILIPSRVEKIENKMRKLGYVYFDYDSKPYALVKCYK